MQKNDPSKTRPHLQKAHQPRNKTSQMCEFGALRMPSVKIRTNHEEKAGQTSIWAKNVLAQIDLFFRFGQIPARIRVVPLGEIW